jgi:hypothetical protein
MLCGGGLNPSLGGSLAHSDPAHDRAIFDRIEQGRPAERAVPAACGPRNRSPDAAYRARHVRFRRGSGCGAPLKLSRQHLPSARVYRRFGARHAADRPAAADRAGPRVQRIRRGMGCPSSCTCIDRRGVSGGRSTYTFSLPPLDGCSSVEKITATRSLLLLLGLPINRAFLLTLHVQQTSPGRVRPRGFWQPIRLTTCSSSNGKSSSKLIF